ncbi:unnamed protein product [Heligmosomoides polygyrus]|uniref:TSC-22/dip/bun family protein n=1 Tax=Heligmosomoides polygyrus TaxID=6339 RepID=A0A183GS28_HELPZ|nr:unnamed protein product [Heligmosomoides polygyrus]
MKKRPIQFGDSPSPMDFDRAADVLIKDETIPLHLRTIIAFLIENKKQTDAVLSRNRELAEEVVVLTREVKALKEENSMLRNSHVSSQVPAAKSNMPLRLL